MQPPSAGLWSRVPGYESSDASDLEEDLGSSDDTGHGFAVERRLQQVLAELGDRWVDVPLHRFAPASMPSRSSSLNSPTSLPSKSARAYSRAAGPRGSYFRIDGCEAPLVRETLVANGLQPTSKEDWMVQWSGPRVSNATYWQLDECQRLNHFPASTELTDKDRLWAHFRHMKEQFGSAFDFVPESFVLPKELDEFTECYKLKGGLWIVKKTNGSCGRDVFLLRDLRDLPKGSQVWVVSRYISNPLLIQGLKFDLRIYVLVTGYEPLCAYIYREGLARFASRAYSVAEEHLKDQLRHLTNYSINKFARNFVENQDVHADNYGHKWSLSALNKHLKCTGVNVDLMWSRIMDAIVKTLLAVEPAIRSKAREMATDISGCFELYGFDVLVDSDLKPWLLEVNLSPSMSADSPLDWQVKSSLVSDTLNLVGVHRGDLETIRKQRWCLHQLQARRAAMGFTRAPKARVSPNRPTCHKSPFRSSAIGHSTQPQGGRQRLRRRSRQSRAPRSRDVEAGEFVKHPVMLDTLSVGQLKMLARRLRERRRSRNFLHLHPTRATAARYGPIVDAREPWPSAGDDAFYRGGQLSAAQLFSSILFGPRPCTSTSIEQTTFRPRPPRRRQPVLTGRDEADRQMESNLDSKVAGAASNGARIDKSGHAPKTAQQKLTQAMLNLGRTGYFQLAWMEYLLRIANVCDVLSAMERARLAQSGAYSKLVAFRQQLLRVRTGNSISTCLDEDKQLGAESGEQYGFVDELASTCKEFVACLASVTRGETVSPGIALTGGAPWATHQNPRLCDGSLALQQYLPPTVLESAFLAESAASIQSLTTTEIEQVIQSSECASEFGNLLKPVEPLDPHSQSADKKSRVFSPFDGELYQGKTSGPLSELLQVSADLTCQQATTDTILKRPDCFQPSLGPPRHQNAAHLILKGSKLRSKSSVYPLSRSLPAFDDLKWNQCPTPQQNFGIGNEPLPHAVGISLGIWL